QGRLRAPANGQIVKLHRFPGERCRQGEAVVALLEEGSLQVVLYLPQDRATAVTVDNPVELVLEPYAGRLGGTVARIGDCYDAAPDHLKRHYVHGEKVLPVYVRPHPEAARWMALKINGVVKLP